MPKRSDVPPSATRRPSSHMRLSTVAALHARFAAADAVITRRLRQLAAAERKLAELGIEPPPRMEVPRPTPPAAPRQFDDHASGKRERSVDIVRMAIAKLKLTTCKARSPSKGEIVAMSRNPAIDRSGKGISKSVFRTNQECLDLYLAACLPAHASRRKAVATPSWAVRMEREALISMVMAAEAARDDLTRQVMAANEPIIAAETARIRKEVVEAQAKRLLSLAE